LAQRYSPDLGPREPIKPLRIKEEEPGGFIGFLIWWRKRGGVFWWTMILIVLSIGTLVGVLIPVARSMGHLDVRPDPDITATIKADKTSVSKGDTVTLTIAHENIGGSEAGAVTVSIHLPDELTARSVQPGTPACSQASKLERFASEVAGQINGQPGGTMLCLLGTRVSNAKGEIILEAEVGDVAAGADFNVDVWLATYRTDNVRGVKEEKLWSNNCTSLSLMAGSGGSPTARSLECTPLGLIAQSIVVTANPEIPAPGEPFTLTAAYENIPVIEDGEQESIAVDIRLPNELTAGKLLQYNDDKALTEGLTCSHPNQTEEFASEGKGPVTTVSGGTLTCLVKSRSDGAEGRVRVETSAATVASGSTINVDVCARREQDASAAPENCKSLAVLVQEPQQ
jgi:uncharacterized repeat protein (TIGR01451 family)